MNETAPPEPTKFVSIRYFWQDMLGMASKSWFYDHIKDPGFPQPVEIGGRKMIVLAEAEAYMRDAMARRHGERREKIKRRVGRPAKLPERLR